MEEKLIEAVRVRKVLYDKNHADYLKVKVKAKKWEEVAKETGISNGAEAKTLWEKLRHSLRDAIRRQQKCMKSGAAGEAVKQWKFQKQMGFLQPYMANKIQEGNLNEDIDYSETPLQNYDGDSPADAVEECDESQNMQALPETKPLIQVPTSSKKKKKGTVAGFLKHKERRNLRSEERKRILKQMSSRSGHLYHFFMSMYEMTKNMPLSSQFIVRNNIFRVVTDMEATLLNFPPRSPQSNTVQGPSYNELSLSTQTHSSHSDSSFPNPDESCDFV